MPGIDKVTVTYLTSGRELKTMDITKEALSGEEITLEQGLDVEDYLAGRVPVTAFSSRSKRSCQDRMFSVVRLSYTCS